jgi:hypothetical protein
MAAVQDHAVFDLLAGQRLGCDWPDGVMSTVPS